MGAKFPSSVNNTIVASPSGAGETVILTSTPIAEEFDYEVLLIEWYYQITVAASSTMITAKLRRGTGITGTVVNLAQAINVTASTSIQQSGCYFDAPGPSAGQQYSLTVTIAGAAAASPVSDVCMIVIGA